MKKIECHHTLEEYFSLYGDKKAILKVYTKEEVEEYDKFKKTPNKQSLLNGKSWWLIDDKYYEVVAKPKRGFPSALVGALAAFAVMTAVVVPIFIDSKTPEPIPEVTYTVEFRSEGGSYVESQVIGENCKVTKPSDPTLDGNVFCGWLYNGEPFDFENTKVTKDIVLYASWNCIFYKIEYIVDDALFTEDQVNDNCYLTKPVNPTKENCLFMGWYKEKECTNLFDFNTEKASGDLKLYAKWESAVKTVTFKLNSTTVIDTKMVATNASNPTVSPLSTKYVLEHLDVDTYKDCEICGWYTDEGLTNLYDFSSKITNDVTLYPKWKLNAKGFKMFGSHNIDLENSCLFQAIYKSNEPDEEEISGIDCVSKNELCTYSGSNFVIPNGEPGSDVLTFTKTYLDPDGVKVDITENYDIEIASFDKLDLEQLENGVAKAKSTDIEGKVYIPRRYYSETKGEWITITSVASQGFDGCNKVTNIHIPIPTITFGVDAFKSCEALEKIDFQDKSNTWNFTYTDQQGKQITVELDPAKEEDQKKIVENVKKGGSSLKVPTKTGLTFVLNEDKTAYLACEDDDAETTLPDDVLIPAYVYWDEENNEWVTTYDETKSKPVIGLYKKANDKGAFSKSAIKTLTIHPQSNLTSLGDLAFKGCENLTEVNFSNESSDKITEIGKECFAYTTNLKSISLPNKINLICANAFSNSGITSIVIPDSVSVIGVETFSYCTSLSNVIYSKKLDYIPEKCFVSCDELKSFEVPSQILHISPSAFEKSGLVSLSFEDDCSGWRGSSGGEVAQEVYMYAQNNSAEAKKENADMLRNSVYCGYKFDKMSTDNIENNLFAFSVNDDGEAVIQEFKSEVAKKFKITEIVIPNTYVSGVGVTYTVTEINSRLLIGNSDITSITVPNTIEIIGDFAFSSMPKLETLNLPCNTEYTTISMGLCEKDPNLKNITVPSNVDTINSGAFSITKEDYIGSSQGLESADFGVNRLTWRYETNKLQEIITEPSTGKRGAENMKQNAVKLRTKNNFTWYKDLDEASEMQTVNFMTLKDSFVSGSTLNASNFLVGVAGSDGHYSNNYNRVGETHYSEGVLEKSNKGKDTSEYKWTDIGPKIKEEKDPFVFTEEKDYNFRIQFHCKPKLGTKENIKFDTFSGDKPSPIKISSKGATSADYLNFTPINNENGEKIGYEVSFIESHAKENIKEIVIPSSFQGSDDPKAYPVISVGNAPGKGGDPTGFRNLEFVETITIPDTVTNIGVGAFANSKIKKINMSCNLKNIMAGAFYNCPNLTSLSLPASLKYFDSLTNGDEEDINKIYLKSLVFFGVKNKWQGESYDKAFKATMIPYVSGSINMSFVKSFNKSHITCDENYNPINDVFK